MASWLERTLSIEVYVLLISVFLVYVQGLIMVIQHWMVLLILEGHNLSSNGIYSMTYVHTYALPCSCFGTASLFQCKIETSF